MNWILTETYVIEDLLLYRASPTTVTGLNIPMPENGIISFKVKKLAIQSSGGGGSVELNDDTHTYFLGNWASNGLNGFLLRNTSSSSNIINKQLSNLTARTEPYLITVIYRDTGEWEYKLDNESITFNCDYTPLVCNKIENGATVDVSYLKIKVL